MNIFQKKTSAQEALGTSIREMSVATWGVEREIAAFQLEEKNLVAEMKKTAKTGNEATTRILARQLIRLRQQITNLQGTHAQIRGVATHTQAMHASTSIYVGMKRASKAMAAMNKQMEPAKQAEVMEEFQKQSPHIDMTQSIDEKLWSKMKLKKKQRSSLTRCLMNLGSILPHSYLPARKDQITAAKKVENNHRRSVTPETPDLGDLEKRFGSLKAHLI